MLDGQRDGGLSKSFAPAGILIASRRQAEPYPSEMDLSDALTGSLLVVLLMAAGPLRRMWIRLFADGIARARAAQKAEARDRGLFMLRSNESYDTFAACFQAEDVPERILAEVYRFFQSRMSIDGFPVRPSDSIGTIYWVVGEEVDSMLSDLCRVCECSPPHSDDDFLALVRMRTVADVVRLLARLARR